MAANSTKFLREVTIKIYKLLLLVATLIPEYSQTDRQSDVTLIICSFRFIKFIRNRYKS
jgi:hypothetical protein